ncbi:hypothetical protein [Rhizobium sp. YS-1r]|uniref:hypothetical protein n=1 Tax=Rhizobium sp. YS-1r TaxID=1532558 RepID=UPI00050E78CB|nr:hypothetical protein [Rhizobium sp. YS-1r]KGE01594.1 hypothetical protein JL39_04260 [Rhizobium sp. YS-1r]
MGWTFAVCVLIGAVCALRMPILVFAIVAFIVMAVYAAMSYAAGSTAWQAIGWGFLFAALLEAGYVVSYWLLYFFYSRRTAGKRETASRKVQSRYSAD